MDELIRQHIGGLRLFVRAQLDPVLREQESASDLVQTVCREVLQKLDKYSWQGEGSFRAWLYKLAFNKLRDRRKFHTAQQRNVAQVDRVSVDRLPPEEMARAWQVFTSPTQHAIRDELVEMLEAALDKLPQNYRDVILQSRIVGLSNEEIAQDMDTTPGNVRVLLHRALARLATELQPLA